MSRACMERNTLTRQRVDLGRIKIERHLALSSKGRTRLVQTSRVGPIAKDTRIVVRAGWQDRRKRPQVTAGSVRRNALGQLLRKQYRLSSSVRHAVWNAGGT